MREIRTSGGRRSEATGRAWYADIEAQPGKPRNRTMPTPKHVQSLAYSTSINSRPFLVSASRLQIRADPPPCFRVPVRDPGPSSVQSEPRRAHSPPHSVWPASQLRAGVELRSRSRAAATAGRPIRRPRRAADQRNGRYGESSRASRFCRYADENGEAPRFCGKLEKIGKVAAVCPGRATA